MNVCSCTASAKLSIKSWKLTKVKANMTTKLWFIKAYQVTDMCTIIISMVINAAVDDWGIIYQELKYPAHSLHHSSGVQLEF